MKEKIRAFIAIDLPDEVKEALKRVQEELKKSPVKASWPKVESMHLTVRFIGDIDAGIIEDVTAALEDAACGVGGFELRTDGLGGFPSLDRPRVLWIGIEESPELRLLYEKIEKRLEAIGFERDKKGFHPHITICRIQNPADRRALGRRAGTVKEKTAVAFSVREVILYRSDLKPTGAVHTVLKAVELKG